MLVLAAVSDRGGVVAAAEMLHLTPSAVSQQLVRLERDAGVSLVDRSRRQARLTVAGEQLADRGRRIASELLSAEADVAQWFGASGTTVVVAAFSTAIKRLLAPLVPQLEVGNDVIVRIAELDARRALAGLHAGDVDVALVETSAEGTPLTGPVESRSEGEPSTARLRSALRMHDDYRIAVPADWPAADWLAAGDILEELSRLPWVAASPGSASRAALDRLSAAWAFTPRIAHECNESASLVALVGAGMGTAVMPHLAWADVTERTLLLDNDDVEQSAGVAPGMGVRHMAVLLRDSARPVPATELCVAAIRRVADAEQLTIDDG